jgi:hypothetical protein
MPIFFSMANWYICSILQSRVEFNNTLHVLGHSLLQTLPPFLATPFLQQCERLTAVCGQLQPAHAGQIINKLSFRVQSPHDGQDVIPVAMLSPSRKPRVFDLGVQHCCNMQQRAVFDVVGYCYNRQIVIDSL